jgi:hypothetical protein
MLDSALAASNAKLQQLKKTHFHLLEQHTELQMKFHDLEGERQAEKGRFREQERSGWELEQPNFSRSSSMRQSNNHNSSRYLPPLSTEAIPREESEHQSGFQSPTSMVSPPGTASSGRPSRFEPSQRPQRSQTTPSPYPAFGGSFVPDFSAAYDASLNSQFQAAKQGNTPRSSDQSSYSVDTEGSAGKEKKEKVTPKSEVRVYGRGKSSCCTNIEQALTSHRWRPKHQQKGKRQRPKETWFVFEDWRVPRTQRHHVRPQVLVTAKLALALPCRNIHVDIFS